MLDVGCGAGDNAALIKSRDPTCEIYGITYSASEAALARQHMASCWVLDIEAELPADLIQKKFNAILFSHILEHLREPAAVLSKFSALLENGGVILIAVPNVLSWPMRWQLLRGNFEYQSAWLLDLLSQSKNLRLISKTVTGSVPLWWLRRYIFPKRFSEYIDSLGCRYWPNLFGAQIEMKIVKNG
jgi:2-polyprenyl-3-methyl-5-hydroxy-6-metoxy-1,4-benzoquinol methylase